jgi:hypothetical protein
VKLLFEKEQVQNEERNISGLNMYLETLQGFPCLIFLFNVQVVPQNRIHVFTNSVRVKYTYKCMCYFKNPNSEVSDIFLLLTTWIFRSSKEMHFLSTPDNLGSLIYFNPISAL